MHQFQSTYNVWLLSCSKFMRIEFLECVERPVARGQNCPRDPEVGPVNSSESWQPPGNSFLTDSLTFHKNTAPDSCFLTSPPTEHSFLRSLLSHPAGKELPAS